MLLILENNVKLRECLALRVVPLSVKYTKHMTQNVQLFTYKEALED